MGNRIIVLTLLLVFAVAACAQAEGAGIAAKGIKAGINMATHRGSDTDNHKYRTAFVGGGFLTYAFAPSMALQGEVLYSQKGYKIDEADYKETGRFSYIEIPVIFKYMIQMQSAVTPNLYAGIAPAFLLSAEEEWEYTGSIGAILGDSNTDDVKDYSNSFDFGLVFGGGLDFAVGNGVIAFDVRYDLGLMKVYDFSNLEGYDGNEHPDIKNQAFTIMAGYGF